MLTKLSQSLRLVEFSGCKIQVFTAVVGFPMNTEIIGHNRECYVTVVHVFAPCPLYLKWYTNSFLLCSWNDSAAPLKGVIYNIPPGCGWVMHAAVMAQSWQQNKFPEVQLTG